MQSWNCCYRELFIYKSPEGEISLLSDHYTETLAHGFVLQSFFMIIDKKQKRVPIFLKFTYQRFSTLSFKN